jgi:hypothetical protein
MDVYFSRILTSLLNVCLAEHNLSMISNCQFQQYSLKYSAQLQRLDID